MLKIHMHFEKCFNSINNDDYYSAQIAAIRLFSEMGSKYGQDAHCAFVPLCTNHFECEQRMNIRVGFPLFKCVQWFRLKKKKKPYWSLTHVNNNSSLVTEAKQDRKKKNRFSKMKNQNVVGN